MTKKNSIAPSRGTSVRYLVPKEFPFLTVSAAPSTPSLSVSQREADPARRRPVPRPPLKCLPAPLEPNVTLATAFASSPGCFDDSSLPLPLLNLSFAISSPTFDLALPTHARKSDRLCLTPFCRAFYAEHSRKVAGSGQINARGGVASLILMVFILSQVMLPPLRGIGQEKKAWPCHGIQL